jgi:NADH:ubiquinone oxidoreductase subunit 5 (subunit L)/multisubunit Na+/H+ antiporter MnhA subunit
MYLLILIFPLIGFLLSGLLGKYFGRIGSAYLSTISLFLTLLLSIIFFYEICLCKSVINIKLYSWMLLDIFTIDIGFLFDTVSVTMIFIISIISFFVHLYSNIYMSHDPHISRFMSYLSLFTFFMLVLVTSDNFFQLFVGWEGVGLCSYLLINFWYTRILANKASLKAMVMNRIADVFFILGIILLFLIFKTTDYLIIFNLLPYIYQENLFFLNFYINKIDLIAFLLFIGSIGKSAQIGLHTWLPDAMEGPTPVSALLHAATMVTQECF